jgi:GAF domain-containing protein
VVGKPVLDPEAVVRTLHRASAQGASREQLLQLAATEVHAFGEPYTGVYLYMLHGDSLELEAFAGRATEHTRIAVGTGICGRAVSEDRDLNVPDVTRAEGYLACSAETKSELVVLLRRDGAVLGQIDIDSDIPDGFPAAEEAAVRQVADALAALL